jgi:uncharacterized membrane protein YhaH (DUF805 family)
MRVPSIIAAIVGALGSEALMLVVGRTAPTLLLVMFTLWVLSPFAGLYIAHLIARRWSEATRNALYWVTLIISVISLLIYGYFAFSPQPQKPTFIFVVTPPVSWGAAVLCLGVTALVSRSRPPKTM